MTNEQHTVRVRQLPQMQFVGKVSTHGGARGHRELHEAMLRFRYFILLANTNVNVDGAVMCMHIGKKNRYEVATTVPRQHSNDRLTVPVQNMMTMNHVL